MIVCGHQARLLIVCKKAPFGMGGGEDFVSLSYPLAKGLGRGWGHDASVKLLSVDKDAPEESGPR